MSGKFKGCAAIIQKLHPEAVYVHCANHSLNLAIANACKIPSIRNCISTMNETVNLFRLSPKAGTVLKNEILKSNPSAKQLRLLKFCETRWVEYLDSLSLFYESYHLVCTALEELETEHLRSDVSKPHTLLAAIQSSQFIVAMAVLMPIFTLSKNLSIFLQQVDCDLSSCVEFANKLFSEVTEMRKKSDQSFSSMFECCKKIATEADVDIKIPRLVSRQTNRDNYEGGPEEYYRRSIYIPFLDHFLDQLQERFLNHGKLISSVENILPHKCIHMTDAQMQETVNVLQSKWPNELEGSAIDFIAESKIWKRHWASQENLPKTFIETFNLCDARMFGYINRFLKIAATLPVSVASSERSFSTLRRLKTYLRNKTGAERLNGLALLNVHREINVEIEDILNDLAQNRRKLNIIL